MEILEQPIRALFPPKCEMCNGSKSMKLKGKYYCPNCEKGLLEAKVAEGL